MRVAFPLMIVCLLLVMPLLGRTPQLAAACYDAGYTMLSIFVTVMFLIIVFQEKSLSARWGE